MSVISSRDRAAWPACCDLDATFDHPASTVQPTPAHAAYSGTRTIARSERLYAFDFSR
jgi:hypothetical protein